MLLVRRPEYHPLSINHERSARHVRHLRIAADYAAGVPVVQIAEQYGVARTTVSHIARRLGIAPRDRKRSDHAAILFDYRLGLPIADIAARHKVSLALVVKVAQEAGEPPRYAATQTRRSLALDA